LQLIADVTTAARTVELETSAIGLDDKGEPVLSTCTRRSIFTVDERDARLKSMPLQVPWIGAAGAVVETCAAAHAVMAERTAPTHPWAKLLGLMGVITVDCEA